MTDSPTTENGPLHTPDATLDERLIHATFKTPDDAQIARERLIQGGIAADRVSVIDASVDSPDVRAALEAKDQGRFARLRETILLDDNNTATTNAVKHHEASLELRPTKEEFDLVVKLSRTATYSNAHLERWRNAS